ncbi:uncharacterized protein LOC126682737 [Mercurialis annua]|uniref:uncharacterized protein LOC126682737 n=1 Tax=Mercurialis annua TaxID=3986 RepID=UPI00215E141E|nr:uncharacterized protein LOC126682737 [Mercurialis annua]
MKTLENMMTNHQNSLKSLFQRKRSSSSVSISNSKEGDSPSADGISPIPQLSPLANSVVARCSRVLGVATLELQHQFDIELPESVKQLFTYARNFVEFCFYKTLNSISSDPNFLSDKDFRRLTYDMMLAWESPCIDIIQSLPNEAPSPKKGEGEEKNEDDGDEDGGSLFYSSPTTMAVQVDDTKTVGREAFARIAPACAVVADVMTAHNLFDALTTSSAGRLHFLIFDKYLHTLDKILKAAKIAPGSFFPNLQLAEGEIILDVDGTVPTQPVLQHIGLAAWPGRLTLTNYALYFESLGVGLYDKAVRYDLAMDMKQVIKPELTGPLGARLFDKAVMYKSASVVEPVYFEFPEFKGNSRRDYWLDICLEILHAHQFVRKNNFTETQQLELLARASLGIFRCRAVREAFHIFSSHYKSILSFKMADSLPRGDMILETLSSRLTLLTLTASPRNVDGSVHAKQQRVCSPVALLTLSQLGFTLKKELNLDVEAIAIGDLCAGEISPLEIAVKQSVSKIGKVEAAQATVDKVKVEGIDTNVAVMKELLYPIIELVNHLQVLVSWEDPFKSALFMVLCCYAISRGWTRYFLPSLCICSAVFMLWRRHFNKKKPLEAFRVTAPPNKNAVEQLLTLQEAISQVEALIQTANIILLKIRALLFSVLPQATETVALMLAVMAVLIAFVPLRQLILLVFLEAFTREMPYRKENSDRLRRRLREWWIRIPAAPVQLIKLDDSKKKK